MRLEINTEKMNLLVKFLQRKIYYDIELMLFFYLAAVNAKGSLLCIERSPIVIHTGLSSSNKMEAKTKITRKIIIPNDNQSMKIYL